MTRLKTDAFVSLRRPNRLRRPHARREDARPAPGLHAGRRAPSRPGSSRAGSRPGSRGGAESLSRPGSSRLRRLQPRREDSLAARGGARGSSLSGVRGRPATGFGASRHEEPSEFGASGDDFGSDGHAGGPGGPAASALQKAQKARELAARRRRERQMGGCGTEHGNSNRNLGVRMLSRQTTGALRGERLPRRLAPDGARGFQRPRPPAQPRPTSGPAGADGAARANPLFAGTAAPSASGVRARLRVAASRLGVRAHARGPRVRGGGGVSGGASFAPSRRGRAFRRVWDRNRDPGEPGVAAPRARRGRAPGRRTSRRGGPGHAQPGGGGDLGPTRVPDPARAGGGRPRAVPHPAPARQGGVLGLGAKRYPEYFLYLDGPGTTPGSPTDGATFLLSARRRKKSTSSNYVISLDEEDLNRHGGRCFFEAPVELRRHGVHRVRQRRQARRDRAERRPQGRRALVRRAGREAAARGDAPRPELNSARFGTTTTCWARRARGS